MCHDYGDRIFGSDADGWKPETVKEQLTVAALTSLVFGVKTAEEICADGDAVMSDRMKEELDKIIPLSQIYLNETV